MLPDCTSEKYFDWVAGFPDYHHGSIVKHKDRRYQCRIAARCGNISYEPGTLYGKDVWQVLKKDEAVDLTMDNYSENNNYQVSDKIIYMQYEWECFAYDTYCSNPAYNPVSMYGHLTWMRLELAKTDLVCSTGETVGTSTGTTSGTDTGTTSGTDTGTTSGTDTGTTSGTDTGTTSGTGTSTGSGVSSGSIFDPTSSDNDTTGEYAIPNCLSYPLYQFDQNIKSYDFGDIVEHLKKRYKCFIKVRCNTAPSFMPGDGSGTWKQLKADEAVNLSKDDYQSISTFQFGDSVILHGITFQCQIPGWCILPYYSPVGADGTYAWNQTGTVSGDFDCYSTPATDTGTPVTPDPCKSYFLNDWVGTNPDYIAGSLVTFNDNSYRCIDSALCKFENFEPGLATTHDIWQKIEAGEISDLRNDNYLIGKIYKQDDEIIYHQVKFKCINFETFCSSIDYNPYLTEGKLAWKKLDKHTDSFTCDGGVTKVDGEVWTLLFSTGNLYDVATTGTG